MFALPAYLNSGVTNPLADRLRTIALTSLCPLSCQQNGIETDLPHQKLRFALLVYIASERTAPRAKICALLWPEVDELRACNRLKQVLYEVRQSLGPEVIVTDADELRAGDHLTVDARDFGVRADAGHYEQALGLYSRFFLDGFYVDAGATWERWVDRKRAILARTFAHVVRFCTTNWLDRHEYERAIRCA